MKSFIAVLGIAVALLGLSSCRTVEVPIPAAHADNISRFTLTYQKDDVDIRVFFPEGWTKGVGDTRLAFIRDSEHGLSKSFPFMLALTGTQDLEISSAEWREVSGAKSKKLDILLGENLHRLPVYQQPEEIQYSSEMAFKSSGRLVTEEGNRLGYCNGTLVAPNLVLTNAHCMKDATDCDRANFLMSVKSEGEVFACTRHVLTHQAADQSLFEIDRVPKKPFEVAKITPAEYLYPIQSSVILVSTFGLWKQVKKGSWKAEKGTALLSSKACQIQKIYSLIGDLTKGIESALMRDQYKTSTYELNCPVVHGQSGSGVYNISGELIGSVWGMEKDADAKDEESTALFSTLHSSIRSKIIEYLARSR